MTKMIGKLNQPFCGSRCCGVPSSHKPHKRGTKRSERNKMRASIANRTDY